MVNCLFESPLGPHPLRLKEEDEILLCVVVGRAGLVSSPPPKQRLGAELGCFNCPESGCSSTSERTNVPRVSWKGVNGGPGCLFEFICREVFKGGWH